MIQKTGYRLSEKIMLKQKERDSDSTKGQLALTSSDPSAIGASGDGALLIRARETRPNFTQQPLHIDRLCIEIGAPDLDALGPIAGERVRCQRDDRD